ncbi:MAG: type II toxin-antitoxin system HicA family toxin [Proteobacteria bacterium]|jgi:predicted RNA binding protein YcfA (HicA-like mRNA interferase family)|nr:type II toxin-antitoxin system HicA family toxin [Pseudomonadota bacterium]
MKFTELVRLLEGNGFKIIKEKGSIRYYGKQGWGKLIRLDYHGSKKFQKAHVIPSESSWFEEIRSMGVIDD